MARSSRTERGAILIWSTFAILMVAILVAVVVNVGRLTSTRGELQNAVDAAALASARELSGRAAQLEEADLIAADQADVHRSEQYDVVASDVRFGTWNPANRPCPAGDTQMPLDRRDGYSTDDRRFCEVTATDEAAAFRINAVYVRAQRRDGVGGGGSVPMLFGGLLNRMSAPVMSSAIAVTGGPCGTGDCQVSVPMVVGIGCLTDDPRGGNSGSVCDPSQGEDAPGPTYMLGLSSTQVRSAGWSLLSQVQPTPGQLCDFLRGGGISCPDVGSQVSLVDVRQGSNLDTHCGGCGGHPEQICNCFQQRVGQSIQIPVISYSGSSNEACPSTYNGDAYVMGYATFRVTAVNCSASARQPDCVQVPGANFCLNNASPCNVASGMCVLTQLVCNHRNGDNHSTGCAWTGTSPLRPVLVR
jgi:hypothetical protein